MRLTLHPHRAHHAEAWKPGELLRSALMCSFRQRSFGFGISRCVRQDFDNKVNLSIPLIP